MGLNRASRTVNVSKNAITALLSKLFVLFLTFLSRRVFIQYIGIEYLGINGLFANILTLLSMADLGLGTAMNVSLYRPIADKDTNKLAALMNYFQKLYYIISAIVFIIGLLLIPVLPYIIKLDREIPHLYFYYVIYVANTAASYLFVYKSSIINADQKNYIINIIDIVLNTAKIVLQIVVALVLKNYAAFLIVELIITVVRNIALSMVADKQYPFINEKAELGKEEKKRFNDDVFSAFLYRIGGSILGGTDNILISSIVGTVAVGLYYNYCTITSALETVISLLFGSFTASVGNLIATTSNEKRYITYKTMQMIGNWLAALISICLFFLCQEFIGTIWLHDSSLLMDEYVLIAIVINMYYTICMRPVWTYREGTGMYRQIRYLMLFTAGINVVLSIILGKKYGTGGILIATSISKLLTCFWYEPYLLYKNFFGVNPTKYYIEYFINVVLTIVCGILCSLMIVHIHGEGIVIWLIKAIIISLFITIVFALRYYKTEEFNNLRNKLMGRH